jgi:pimeloyl-ACP methyl ester carboxylesterase
MGDQEPQFLELGRGTKRRRIAYRLSPARGEGELLWLPGFLSDMGSTKAIAVAEWAEARGLGLLRFDYSGHGLSGGALLDATMGDWLEESVAMSGLLRGGRVIVIGSSMGGWLALLLARHLAQRGNGGRLGGFVLIAPAWDMTETLMWRQLPPEAKNAIARDGVYHQPSLYGDPYPITRGLIEEGRAHLFGGSRFDPGAPVRILQGMRDPDVPFTHALALVDLLAGEDVELSLIKDGDHRLSRPRDLRRLEAAIALLAFASQSEDAGSNAAKPSR